VPTRSLCKHCKSGGSIYLSLVRTLFPTIILLDQPVKRKVYEVRLVWSQHVKFSFWVLLRSFPLLSSSPPPSSPPYKDICHPTRTHKFPQPSNILIGFSIRTISYVWRPCPTIDINFWCVKVFCTWGIAAACAFAEDECVTAFYTHSPGVIIVGWHNTQMTVSYGILYIVNYSSW
jgi:hypothetical protein